MKKILIAALVVLSLIVLVLAVLTIFRGSTMKYTYANAVLSEGRCLFFVYNAGNYPYVTIVTVECEGINDYTNSELGFMYAESDSRIIDSYVTANCPAIKMNKLDNGDVEIVIELDSDCAFIREGRGTLVEGNIKLRVTKEGGITVL